jgi:hypothetical protein
MFNLYILTINNSLRGIHTFRHSRILGSISNNRSPTHKRHSTIINMQLLSSSSSNRLLHSINIISLSNLPR